MVAFSDSCVELGFGTGCEPVDVVMLGWLAWVATKAVVTKPRYLLQAHHDKIPCGPISKVGVWDDNAGVDGAFSNMDVLERSHPMTVYGAYLEVWLVYKYLTTQRKSTRDWQYPKRIVSQAWVDVWASKYFPEQFSKPRGAGEIWPVGHETDGAWGHAAAWMYAFQIGRAHV